MIAEIEEADQRRIAEMKQAAEKVALAQAELTAEKANLEATKEALAVTEAELKAKGVVANELLAELIATAAKYALEAKRLCLLRHKEGGSINLILLQFRKGGKPGLILEEASLFDKDNHPTAFYRSVYHFD